MNFTVAIKDPKNPPALKFPARCLRCGGPQETTMKIAFNMGVEKRSRVVLMDLQVPLCNDHAAQERRIASVTLVPFLIGGVIFGAIAFVPAWLLSPEGTTPDTAAFPFVFGGTAALIVGIIAGTVVEFITRLLVIPSYGSMLKKRPLTIFEFFADSEHLPGLAAKLARDKKSLRLEFESEEFAREFAQMNPQEKK
jgi:hypothetical protein